MPDFTNVTVETEAPKGETQAPKSESKRERKLDELTNIPLPKSTKASKPTIEFTAPSDTLPDTNFGSGTVRFAAEGGEASRPKKSRTSIVGADPVRFTAATQDPISYLPAATQDPISYLPYDVSITGTPGEGAKVRRTMRFDISERSLRQADEAQRKREPMRFYTDEQLQQIGEARGAEAPRGNVRRLIGMFEGDDDDV